ncbi:type I DNA topoisomerase [Candidatus Dojkabacteria bacterium]|nr:type I DNA topoisomerase [Candidatus Dojkabacteria bacterium]
MSKLVVVESPAKAKTIERYLGKDYKVAATMGHIMDLPKSKLAVDVDNRYEAKYTVIHGKKKVITALRKLLPQNDQNVYLAMDPDREGEAIAAHVAQSLKLKKPSRVVFHEITKDAVLEAVENPENINEDLVEAQKARRILDRLVGYKLSELLWKKIWYGLSAGRVQSVATRLIVERERERLEFKPDEFWNITSYLKKDNDQSFASKLERKNGKKLVPSSEKETKVILTDLDGADWIVDSVDTKSKTQHPYPPFTTSTLQQAANNYLGYSAKRTMQIAQQLYQGVKIKGKGQVGLITYMRTDSFNLAQQAVNAIRSRIEKDYGKKYLPEKPKYYKTRSKSAQEAHEAIRPTHFDIHPDDVKESLSSPQYRLYKIIWDRAMGCQMSSMEYNVLEVWIGAVCDKELTYNFFVRGHEVKFDGFARATGSRLLRTDENVQQISGIQKGDILDCEKIETEQKFTKPRPRYTEASLVKTLEKYGIGRPSTYATIISTVQSRGYVGKEGRYLFPTDLGFVVTDFLVEHFSDIVDYDFTSEVEEDLDEIAEGKMELVPVMDKVYKPLEKDIKIKEKEIDKKDIVILGKSEHKCPECGGEMVIRLGRNGKFLSCAKFPECKGMLGVDGKTLEESFDEEKYLKSDPCKECGSRMVLKSGKFGKFWACEKYPDCKTTAPLLLKEKCPECGSNLVERKGRWGKPFIGCSGYPKCRYIKKEKK